MEIKQAIHCQKVYTDETTCEECELYAECTHETQADIARLSISALEKQIPMKPSAYEGYEGKCKCGAVFLDRSTKYCGNCGQALDWGEN